MKRRTLLSGLSVVAAGSGAILGTGAFSTVEASRRVSVSVVDDDEAFLTLEEVGSGGRSVTDGGQLRFNIPGTYEDEHGGTDPTGVGSESVYRFGSDAGGDADDGLFTITNLGSGPVTVHGTQADSGVAPTVTIYEVETGAELTPASPSSLIEVGDSLRAGLIIDTHDVPAREDEYDVSLRITAEKPPATD